MKFKISELAVKKPTTIFMLLLLIVIVGFTSYRAMPKESFPDVTFNHLFISVPYPGASSSEVEAQITNKVEEELQDLEDLEGITSTSKNGSTTIDIEYIQGTDLEKSKADIRDALEKVKADLPDDGNEWVISDFSPADRPIMTINISGEVGLYELKNKAEDLKNRLKRIPNIAEIDRIGGLEKEVKVQVNPKKLQYYKIDLNLISATISNGNKDIPGGSIDVGPMEYQIRIPGEVKTVEEIKNMVVSYSENGPVYIKDLADVEFTFKELTNRSRLNGTESVSLDVKKVVGADMGSISDTVKKILQQEQKRVGDKIHYNILGDQSIDVADGVDDLENNILTGVLFVFIVLILFLGIRNASFVGTAIPLSMLLSFIILYFMDMTLNKIVLFALIVSLGMLVDNAIVVVENIFRHVNTGKNRIDATIIGVSEVAAPVIASTLTTLLAFIPILFMPNVIGDVFSFLPKTLLVTLSCSLVVGLIFNPVLCSTMMPLPKKTIETDEVKLVNRSKFLKRYRKILELALNHPLKTLLIIGLFWWGMVFLYFGVSNPSVKVEFFPKSEPESAKITIATPEGTTLEAADQLVKEIENRIQPFAKHADSIVSNIKKTDSTITLNFPSWEKWEELRPLEVIDEIQKIIPEFSGAEIRVTATGGGPPSGKDVQIELLGNQFSDLREMSAKIENLIKNTKGLVNLENSFNTSRAEIQIIVDREKIAQHGLSVKDVAMIVNMSFQGMNVSEYRIGVNDYDIVLKLDKRYRQSQNDLSALYITTPLGYQVALSELARIEKHPAIGTISHLDLERKATIMGDASKHRSGAEVLKEIQKKLAPLTDEIESKGMRIQYAGANKLQNEAQGFLVQSFFVALFLIFMVLVSQFDSLILPFIILASVLASFSGVMLGFSIHDQPLSIMVGGIGVIALAGVVVNNAIVLIDYIGQLRKKGHDMREAIILSGMTRLRPVLLTAVTTMLGMLPITIGMEINFYQWPFVFFGSESGAMWKPLNVTVLYGIGVATFLTLFMVPTLYYLAESGKENVKKLFRGNKQKKSTFTSRSLRKLFSR
ncbi:MAG: efflux RND transporter permease subunit [Deltaproteobacteria bacterium]|jgi:multidrug efflux pump|nr:efflux RND transporter permease subunit [Deltaproteobacteria bacterium]MBT4527083.1 efflux RND transporter permease subunit [Deltaproteobacteria bacterium]